MQSLKIAPTVEQLAARVRAAHGRTGRPEAKGDLANEIESAARWAEEDGEIGRAMELWALLTDLDPWHAPWWHGRGMLAVRDGDGTRARLFLARAAAIDPGYWPAQTALAELTRDDKPVRASLTGVIRSACGKVSRGDVDAARQVLVEDLRGRDAGEVAEALLAKLR